MDIKKEEEEEECTMIPVFPRLAKPKRKAKDWLTELRIMTSHLAFGRYDEHKFDYSYPIIKPHTL